MARMDEEKIRDLKASHFDLGYNHADKKNDISMYYQDYRAWDHEKDTRKEENTNKFQKSNITLGNDKNTYLSVKEKDFVEHKNFQPSKISDETKRELRSHHFSLGDWNPYMKSMTHENYPEKHVPYFNKANRQFLTNKMRKHNFQIGYGKNNMPNTSYNRDFKDVDPSEVQGGLTKQELKQKLIDLRNTNMVLGQDKPTSVSTMKDDYRKLNVPPIKLNRKELQKTHFELGIEDPDHQTVNRMTYKAHPKMDKMGAEMEKKKLVDDLRSHHWNFGGQASDYGTNNRLDYVKHFGVKKANAYNPDMQKTNFELGKCDPVNATVYQRTMKQYDVQNYMPKSQARDQNMDRGTNWTMGLFPEEWNSEAISNFQKHPPVDMDAINAEAEKNKKSHIQLGDVHKRYLKTEFQDKFKDNFDINARGKIDQQLKDDLRSAHFVLRDDEKFRGRSEYGSNFTKKGGNTQLPPINNRGYEQPHALPGEYITTYRSKYQHPEKSL